MGYLPRLHRIPAQGELEITIEVIESLDRSLDMYNEDLDKLISSSVLEKPLEKLYKYPFAFSDLLIDTETNLRDGMFAYFLATESNFQWCGLAIDFLDTYKDLLNEATSDQIVFKESKILLLELFDARIEGLISCEEQLNVTSSSFNSAFEGLSKLIRFNDLSAEAKQYSENLRVNVENVTKKINETKSKLKEEIENNYFLKLKIQTGNKRSIIGLARKEELLKSIDQLIVKCTEYQARHQEIN